MLDIAQHPAQNLSALFGLVTGTAPFQPTVGAAPNDWTVDIKYIGGGLNAPRGIAVDGSGNIWVANSGNNSISEFSSIGNPISSAAGYTGGGLSGPRDIAVDTSGNVWVTDRLRMPCPSSPARVPRFPAWGLYRGRADRSHRHRDQRYRWRRLGSKPKHRKRIPEYRHGANRLPLRPDWRRNTELLLHRH